MPSSGASLTAVGRGGVGGSGASVGVRVGGSACGGSAWQSTKRKQNGVDKRACAADVRTHTHVGELRARAAHLLEWDEAG